MPLKKTDHPAQRLQTLLPCCPNADKTLAPGACEAAHCSVEAGRHSGCLALGELVLCSGSSNWDF